MIVRPTMGRGGADRVTLTLLEHLDRLKYDITLVLMRAEGDFMDDIPKDVKIYNANSRNLAFFIYPLFKIIKRNKPKVVFSTCGGANMPLAIIAFLLPFRKCDIILSERNILFPPGKNVLKRSLMLFIKALFYRFADKLTAVSLGVKNEMVKKLLVKPDKISVVNNPIISKELLEQSNEKVDHQWFSPDRKKPVIVHAGRFVHQKDHKTLLQSFREVLKEQEANLFLLGDGPLRAEIEALAKAWDIDDNVFFAGFDKNPFRYMALCDVFVLSSKHEGMPGVLIQAMACGAPCISTDCPTGPNEIIKQHEDGILVEVGNPQLMSEAILTLLKHPRKAREIKESGKRAVLKYELQNGLNSYIRVIEA